MKTEEKLNEELRDLKSTERLLDKGFVNITKRQHIKVIDRIEFLKEVLELKAEEKK